MRRQWWSSRETCSLVLGRLGDLDNHIGLGVGEALLVRKCTGNFAVGWHVIHSFNDGLWNRSASRCQRPVTCAHSRSTTTSRALRYDLDLVGYSILGPHLVGLCARDFAMGGLIIDPLDTRDWNRRSGFIAEGCSSFGGVGEVLVT